MSKKPFDLSNVVPNFEYNLNKSYFIKLLTHSDVVKIMIKFLNDDSAQFSGVIQGVKDMKKQPRPSINSRFDNLEKIVHELYGMVSSNTNKINELASIIGGISTTVTTLVNTVNGIVTTLNNLAQRVDDLTTRVDDLTIRVDNLTRRVDDLTIRVNDLTVTVSEIKSKQEDLERRFVEKDARDQQNFTEIKAEIVDIKQRVTILESYHQ
ncbi:hypothetical protein ACW95P_00650 [Candidatus Mycoplasma pogonae]